MKIGIVGYGTPLCTSLESLWKKQLEVESLEIIVDDNTTQHIEFKIVNCIIDIESQFIPNPKIRSKYKRNLKYKKK